MSKKKKSQSKKRTKESHGKGIPVDRRALERTLSDIGRIMKDQEFESPEAANAFFQDLLSSGKSLESPPITPLEEAQDVMYEAFDADGKERIALAHQALEISSDCADAYVLLAEEDAKSLPEAKKLFEQGVQAGERALGAQVFQEDAGHFWGIFETRPYMRARLGLAQSLWWLGNFDEAIGHYREMLRLNPGDNQGVRYLLLTCLLEMGENRAASKLLKEYENDGTAAWAYSQALLMFRENGPGTKSKNTMFKAFETNRHVPRYLLKKKSLPKRLPEYVGFGDESEAISYVADAMMAWEETKGALAWVASQWAVFSKRSLPN